MIYLVFSILSSSMIFVVFKMFTRYRVETLFAIVVNYIVAGSTGLFFYDGELTLAEVPTKPWFLGTVMLGLLFILIFNLMAATAQKVGVSVASVATKMSLVIPVLFGVAMYGEELGTLKVLGIVLALAAVYFTSIKQKSVAMQDALGVDYLPEVNETNNLQDSRNPKERSKQNPDERLKVSNRDKIPRWEKSALLLPLLVFLGSGVIDTSIKYFQEYHIQERDYPIFSASVFAVAALTGIIYILVKAIKNPLKISPRNIFGGIALGIPNYFSIYFLLRALQHDSLNSASVFTINNVAIVMFSTLLGIVLFREPMSIKNWSGIGLAVVSIILVAMF